MRAVVQRVTSAEVRVGGAVTGAVGRGLLVLLGVGPDDDDARARHLATRVVTLRLHADDAGRMNRDLVAAGGGVLVVPQFTLHADASHGHRPSFAGAAPPDLARPLCDAFCDALRALGVEVQSGVFGARMTVTLTNDGPVTIVLSSGEPAWNADAG